MALRLSSDLRKNSAISGFDLIFTNGMTYDLDELTSLKRRTDADKGLVIEVKSSEVIAQKAIKQLKADVDYSVNSNNANIKKLLNEKLSEVVKKVFLKYNCTFNTLNKAAYNEINIEMNSYIKSLYKEFNLKFTVYFASTNTVEITFSFVDDFELNKKFSQYYDAFANVYYDYMTVSEGGLAIADIASKINISQQDYKKYLLQNNLSRKVINNKNMCNAPTVIWEEGTIDSTTQTNRKSIYDELADLNNRISEHVERIDYNKNLINDLKDNVKDLPDAFDTLKTDVSDKIESISDNMKELRKDNIRYTDEYNPIREYKIDNQYTLRVYYNDAMYYEIIDVLEDDLDRQIINKGTYRIELKNSQQDSMYIYFSAGYEVVDKSYIKVGRYTYDQIEMFIYKINE